MYKVTYFSRGNMHKMKNAIGLFIKLTGGFKNIPWEIILKLL
jgi:hypothetical protein